VRIHLGHHFYGAGNLGDDFMLAGFLRAMSQLAPDASFSGCVPFPLGPLRSRFPRIDWFEYTKENRAACIRAADIWLGLGGSPFQSAQSRWFIDHLLGEIELSHIAGRPMFFLGIGVQLESELNDADVARVCSGARAIWTRDTASAQRLSNAHPHVPVHATADVSHLLFRTVQPAAATPGRVAVVANSDYADWPQLGGFVEALESLNPTERVWVAQEDRDLPGSERSLFAALSPELRERWSIRSAGVSDKPIDAVAALWPTPEWLFTSRYHAAIASAWGGAKVVVVGLNEKLRAISADLDAPLITPSATPDELSAAFMRARPVAATNLNGLAASAESACREFVAAASAT
jgi:polysaccharide pyruvyl transferase WcaK-like protein